MYKWIGIAVAVGVPVVSAIFFLASLHSNVENHTKDLKDIEARVQENTSKIDVNADEVSRLRQLPTLFSDLDEKYQNLSVHLDDIDKVNLHLPLQFKRSAPTTLVINPGDAKEISLGSDFDWCYFTKIKGKFAGPAESVSLFFRDNHWFISGEKR